LHFECLHILRDRAFMGLLCALLLLTAIALVAGVRWYNFQVDAVAATQQDDLAQQQDAERKGREILEGTAVPPRGWWSNPADVRGYAYYLLQVHAIKPPEPLSALTVGLSDVLPYYMRVSPGRQDKVRTSYEAEHPKRLLIGRFDATFVVIFVLPLLLIAACFNALAAEQESGRLPLLALHGVSLRGLVALRVLLRAGVLALVFLLTIYLGVVVSGIPFSASAVFTWLALALAYHAFWTALILVAVSVCRGAASAALSLAGIWLLLLVIVPGLVNLVVNHLHPPPSRTDFILSQRAASDAADQRRAELLGRYLHDHPELSGVDTADPVIFRFAANIAADEFVEQEVRPVLQRFDQRLLAQQRIIDHWQWASPAIALQLAMTDLAGAGHSRHHQYVAKVDDYVAQLRAFFYPRIARGEYRFADYQQWPRWSWRMEPDQATVTRLFICLSLLTSLTVLGGVFAWRYLKLVHIA
jgi:ABC-2 type transport system permease protein